jgi:hypothetical protein
MKPVPLRSLLGRGLELRPHEAIAIAQQLIHSSADHAIEPFGPLSLDGILIFPDGQVGSRSCAATPAVSEVGRLLDSMLALGGGPVAGGLRYTLARAQLEVDAPPFDSVNALSASLRRFEKGDSRRVVRSFVARVEGVQPQIVAVAPPPCDARQPHRYGWWATAAAAVVASFIVGWLAGHEVRRDEAMPVTSTTVEVPMLAPPVTRYHNAAARPIEMYSPAVSSDGRTIFFHTGGARSPRSALMKRSGVDEESAAIPLVDDGARNYHAQPSPDGRRLAFDSDREGERAVYIADVDGTNIRRVSGTGYAAVPTWSPDGDRLAFIRAEPGRPNVWNLWLLTGSSGELRRLTRFGYGQTWGASWLPGGRGIVFSHEDRIVQLSLTDGRTRTYRTPLPGRIVRTPAVSPDGRRVVFQVWRDGVWILELASGAMHRLLADPTAEEFAWFPDGRRVAYHSRSAGKWAIRVAPVVDSPA